MDYFINLLLKQLYTWRRNYLHLTEWYFNRYIFKRMQRAKIAGYLRISEEV